MPIAINTDEVRQQSNDKAQSALPGVGFSDYLMAANGAAATAIGSTQGLAQGSSQGYQASAMTSAAITGLASTPGSFTGANVPYYSSTPLMTASSPIAAGGLGYSGIPFAGGRACIRGLRIPVSVIVGQIAHGAKVEEILSDYPDLEREDIQQALEYAAWLTQEQIHAM